MVVVPVVIVDAASGVVVVDIVDVGACVVVEDCGGVVLFVVRCI